MILDASVAFKLIVEEPGSDTAMGWIGRAELIAPTLIHAEVGNALWKRVQRGEMANDGAAPAHLADLVRYVRTVDETPCMARAIELAIELAHPVYDCIYLALAEALDDRLLTADERFVRATASTPYSSRLEELGG